MMELFLSNMALLEDLEEKNFKTKTELIILVTEKLWL